MYLFSHLITILILSIQASLLYAFYDANSPVKLITAVDYRRLIQAEKPVLIEYFSTSCGHCIAFKKEYELVGKALKNIILVRAIDDSSVLQQEQIQGVPTVRLYFGHTNNPSYKLYSGQRDAKSLIEFVMVELKKAALSKINIKTSTKADEGKKKKKSSAVVTLNGDNFNSNVMQDENNVWLIAFVASWCGHCKALAPKWETLADELKSFNNIKVAKIDVDQNRAIGERFKVQGFPTIILFPAGKKAGSHVPYDGPREVDDLHRFAKGYITDSLKAEQMISQSQMKENCSKNVCVIAILPDLYDSKATGRKAYITEMNQVVRASSTMPLKFYWLEGGKNIDWEVLMNMQFGYPAVLAIHLDKNKYAIHKGNFNKKDMQSFITGLMSGRQHLMNIPSNMPDLKTTSPWDGKDFVESETPKKEKVKSKTSRKEKVESEDSRGEF